MGCFSLDQIEAFVSVCEAGSFSGAARAIGKDRSTIHKLIGCIEVEWDVCLFDRSGPRPVMLPACVWLLPHCKRLLDQQLQIRNIARNLQQGIEQRLCIAYASILPKEWIISVQKILQDEFPSTCVDFIESDKDSAIGWLIEGSCDLSIQLGSPKLKPPKGLAAVSVGELSYKFYAKRNSLLCRQERVQIHQLEQEKQFIPKCYISSGLGELVTISPDYQIISNTDIIISLLKDRGWALLPCIIGDQSEELGAFDVAFWRGKSHWSITVQYAQEYNNGPVFRRSLELFSHIIER